MSFTSLTNGQAIELAQLAELSLRQFVDAVRGALASGTRLAAYFATGGPDERPMLYAVLADDAAGKLRVARAKATEDSFPSLASEFPQAQLFEREIAEQYALRPEGHPWLKPVRFHAPYRAAGPVFAGSPAVGTGELYRVEGAEVHEVAVGPVHAGIIEPGHFRFQCSGEIVFHLEIALGYQHRGIERKMTGPLGKQMVYLMETAAGDTTIGHATAFCQATEALARLAVPARAQAIRAIALELERLANHVGDLGALAGDVGYLPTASYCGRIRGDFLNLTALICGSRFGRGLVRPGGVGFDLDSARCAQLLDRLEAAAKDTANAVNLLWDTASVMSRFEETGPVSRELGQSLGLVGPAARASGIDQDVRRDFPFGIYRFAHLPVSTWHNGDVFARAYVRWLEIQQSIAFIREQVNALPAGDVAQPAPGGPSLAPDRLAVSLVEGWRGEICHVAITDQRGELERYKVVDPSFHNWFGLAQALRGEQISDFPLCNKSFNLSYCGHDL